MAALPLSSKYPGPENNPVLSVYICNYVPVCLETLLKITNLHVTYCQYAREHNVQVFKSKGCFYDFRSFQEN